MPWSEIFAVWKENEGNKQSWQALAKEKGWKSWEEWRKNTSIANLQADKRSWQLYTIENPMETIPYFRVGPFKSWRQRLSDEHKTFQELVEDSYDWAKQHKGIQKIQKNFPSKTQLIGFIMPDKESIMIFEGHHRAAAIALAIKDSEEIKIPENPEIALSQLTEEDIIDMDELLHKGTEKS